MIRGLSRGNTRTAIYAAAGNDALPQIFPRPERGRNLARSSQCARRGGPPALVAYARNTITFVLIGVRGAVGKAAWQMFQRPGTDAR